MNAVQTVNVHTVVAILQYEKHSFWQVFRLLHHGMQAEWHVIEIRMRFDVFEKIQSEFIKTEIHDGYPA